MSASAILRQSKSISVLPQDDSVSDSSSVDKLFREIFGLDAIYKVEV
jgi:hypothetical protein